MLTPKNEANFARFRSILTELPKNGSQLDRNLQSYLETRQKSDCETAVPSQADHGDTCASLASHESHSAILR